MFSDCPLNSVYLGRPVTYPYSNGYQSYYSPFSRNTYIQTLVVGDEVNDISQYLFYGCSNLSLVILGSNITTLGQYSFYNCPKLKKIELPEKIKSLGGYIFGGTTVLHDIKCDIPSPISITSSVFSQNTYKGNLSIPVGSMDSYLEAAIWKDFTNITAHDNPRYDFVVDGIYYKIVDLSKQTCEITYKDEFSNGYLQTSIIIPEKVNYKNRFFDVVSIGKRAFDGAILLKELYIPQSIKTVSENALDHCTSLIELTLPNSIDNMNVDISDLSLKKVIIYGDGNDLKTWLRGCCTVEEVIFDCPYITSIADSAFYECISLKKILLPNTIQSIGEYAFYGCENIKELMLPSNLRSMGKSAFQSCKKLSSVDFSTSMTLIPSNGYTDCVSLKNIVFGNNIKVIGSNAFINCSSIEELNFDSSIDSIADNAFSGCVSVKKLYICDSSNKIKLGKNIAESNNINGLFSDCPLKEIYIGRDISGETPFDNNKSIEKIEIGHKVTAFPDCTLANMPQLTYLSLGNKLEYIPSFSRCTNLRELIIGSHIKQIPDFSQCLSLNKITVRSAKPQSLESEFANKVYIDCDLFIPKGSLSYYKEDKVWKKFFGINEYDSENEAEFLVFEHSIIDTYPGEILSLTPIVVPFDANEVFTWKSSDNDIAVVNAFGEVMIKKVGEAIITATTTDGSNLSASCNLNVQEVKLVEVIKLEQLSYVVTINEDVKIIAEVLPSDATYKSLIWDSSDNEIATVSNNGLVHGNKVGTCYIAMKTKDGTDIVVNCRLDVLPIFISDMEILTPSERIIEGETIQLSTKYEPENATITDVLWTVSDSAVAQIDKNGLLTSFSSGVIHVWATTKDGSTVFAEKQIEVLPVVCSTISAVINQSTGLIDLKWSPADYVKDIMDYNIYVSEDDEPFVLWMPNTTKTSTSFNGKIGRTYRFVVTMRDKNGHIEKYNENKCVTVIK